MAAREYTGAPQISPDLAPIPTLHIDTPGAAFGAAQAEATTRLGGAIGEAGNELFARAYAMQQLDEQAAAANAISQLSDEVGKLDVDYRSLEGINAKNGYQPFVDSVNKARENIGQNLSSPYAQRLYLQESRAIQSRAVISAGVHAGEQFKHYLTGTAQAEINTARNDIVSNPADDNAFKSGLAKIDSSAEYMKTLKGWSDAQMEDYRSTERSKAVFERATTLARTDPQAAQKVLDSAVKDGYINGEEAGRAGSFIRNQRNTVTSRVEGADFLAGKGGHFGEGKVAPARAREAIAGVESGGNYNPPHPSVTHKVGDRTVTEHALGRYGIMQSNLQPWLKEAGMPAMSEAAFLADHAAQDKLFEFKFGQYQEKYGSANKAAMVWFTGSPNPSASASDGGTTAPAYLQKFNAGLARTATSSEVTTLAEKRANEIVPDDVEFQEHFKDHVTIEHNRALAEQRQEEFDRRQIIDAAIVPGKDGKLVTSIEDIPDPAVREAWEKLQPADRLKYMKIFAANAKGDYAPTEENQRLYHEWVGRLVNPMGDEDREKALNADYASMPMPANQRQDLITRRAKLFANKDRNPALGHAMMVLTPMLKEAGIERKDDDYWLFQGTLHSIMEQRMEETGKPLKDEEVKTIGAGLLREQVTSKGWWSWLDSKGPAFKTEVPEDIRVNIINRYREIKGFEPSAQTIQSLWAAMVYNEFYSKQKAAAK